MARLDKALASDRAARNAARAAFDVRLATIRGDLDARGIGGRIADKLGEDARDMFDEAVEVANHNRGVIAGTIAAVAIWIFRRPIIVWLEGLMGLNDKEEASDGQD